jgi:hypothetical protein
MRRSIVYALIAAALIGLGVVEDKHEFLAEYYPDFLWLPVIPWSLGVLCGCMAVLASLGLKPDRRALLPLFGAVLALAFAMNKVVTGISETLTISGGFDGSISDEKWNEVDDQIRPIVLQTMFWDVYDYAYSSKAMGVSDIVIKHKVRKVGEFDWTDWTISITCHPRKIPKAYRRYAPVPLIVTYFGAKLQFMRDWPADKVQFKHGQASRNFVMELMLEGFPKKSIAKAVECVGLYDDDAEMRRVFREHFERMQK